MRNDDRVRGEVYVGRTELPFLFRRWRWDLTWHTTHVGKHPGVYDTRQHLFAHFGYTRTRWGAWRAVRRAYADAPTYTDVAETMAARERGGR